MSNWSCDQLSLFDDPETPERFVARISHPYWKGSAKMIAEAVRSGCTLNELTEIVKHEYCPYGFAGHYGFHDQYDGYDMTPGNITIHKKDGDSRITWRSFAKVIAEMVESGEYKEEK